MNIIRGTIGIVPRTLRTIGRTVPGSRLKHADTNDLDNKASTTKSDSNPEPCDTSVSNEPMRYKVYTRTGDKGTSSLYNGSRAKKDEDVFWALGETDELNNAVGVAREFVMESKVKLPGLLSQLEVIQSRLLDVGSAVATPPSSSSQRKINLTRFPQQNADTLEEWIDGMDSELPPLTTFILPSGGRAAVFLHVARGVCRRAERRVVPLVREGKVEPSVGIYLNRLSDYFFTAARYAAFKEGRTETTYKKTAPVSTEPK